MLPMIPHRVMVCRGAWRLYEFVEFVPLRDLDAAFERWQREAEERFGEEAFARLVDYTEYDVANRIVTHLGPSKFQRDQRRMEIERHGALQVAGYFHEVFGQWVGVEYAEYIMQDVLNLLDKRDAEEEAKAAT